MNPEQEQTTEHLGDGVYASFDGYAIHLAVNHHMNTVIVLEPDVLKRLNQYAARQLGTQE
jgi:hypothetical protein